ncbi:hypothetical protein HOH45_06645 [bacterium]|jgi:hypothetical protein|nr:hypothetical protein [bacterium]
MKITPFPLFAALLISGKGESVDLNKQPTASLIGGTTSQSIPNINGNDQNRYQLDIQTPQDVKCTSPDDIETKIERRQAVIDTILKKADGDISEYREKTNKEGTIFRGTVNNKGLLHGPDCEVIFTDDYSEKGDFINGELLYGTKEKGYGRYEIKKTGHFNTRHELDDDNGVMVVFNVRYEGKFSNGHFLKGSITKKGVTEKFEGDLDSADLSSRRTEHVPETFFRSVMSAFSALFDR